MGGQVSPGVPFVCMCARAHTSKSVRVCICVCVCGVAENSTAAHVEVNAVVSRRLSISSGSLVCRNAWLCLCFLALDSIFSVKAGKQGFESLVFLKSGIHIWNLKVCLANLNALS